jgi:hypothetical protein
MSMVCSAFASTGLSEAFVDDADDLETLVMGVQRSVCITTGRGYAATMTLSEYRRKRPAGPGNKSSNESTHEMADALQRGHLAFRLNGEKLKGGFTLTRIRRDKDETWLLVKKSDNDADRRRRPVRTQPESVRSAAPWMSCHMRTR